MKSSLLFVLLLAVTIMEVRGQAGDLLNADNPVVDPLNPDPLNPDPPIVHPPIVDPVAEECECEDELPNDICEAIAKVPDNCAKLASAIKCAKTCKMCCKLKRFDCEDKKAVNGNEAPVDCKSVTAFGWCHRTDEPMRSMINEWCQHSCGMCCKDDNKKLCEFAKNDCKNPKTQEKCQLTCGICNSNGCLDKDDDCDTMSSHCTDGSIKNILAKFCPKTCGICGDKPTPVNVERSDPANNYCKDTDTRCARWTKNGFCSNPNYTEVKKRQYCAKSCNLCK